jgi:putative MFS transporter
MGDLKFSVADRMNRIPGSGKQLLIIFFILMGWFAETIDLGGTSYLLPLIGEFFFSPQTGIAYIDPVTTKVAADIATLQSYYASICFFGMFFGAIIAGAMADRLGRKKVMVAMMLLWGASAFALVASFSIPFMFVMRFLLGFGLGAQFPVALSYLSEVVSSKDRPKYMTLYQLMTPVGFLVAGLLSVAVVGAISNEVGWRALYFIEALPALFVIGIIAFVPESPLWLEKVGRDDDADRVASKFEAWALAKHGSLPDVVVSEKIQVKKGFGQLFSSTYLKVTILCFFVWFVSMLSDYGLGTFLTQILKAKGLPTYMAIWMVTLGVFGGIPAWFFTTWATKKLGRKKAFLIAAFTTAVFGIIYGFQNPEAIGGISIGLAGVVIFGILYQFGKYMNAMCMALYTPELYGTEVRGAGNGLATSWGRFGSIIGPFFIAALNGAFGGSITIAIAAGLVIIPGVMVFIMGPETKDKKF